MNGDERVGPDMDPDTMFKIAELTRPALTSGDIPEAFSPAWFELTPWDEAREQALIRAALVWFTAAVFGADQQPDRVLNQAAKDIHAADPGLWSRLARDRATGRPVGRDRRTYPPVPPPRASTDLEAAFQRAGRGADA